MKKLAILFALAFFVVSCSDITDIGSDKPSESNKTLAKQETATQSSEVWVGAYLASWNHYVEPTGNWGNLPTEEIDWDAFTHLYYFALNANSDGSLSTIEPYENMSPDRINAIVSAAHENNKPVMFTVGGWGNYEGFSNAISPSNRSNFIANLVSTIEKWDFDGIDIDMEPIRSSDEENYIAFINELNTALQDVNTPVSGTPLVSVVTSWEPNLFAQIHDQVDHVNLMTYDYSGAWQGWVSWHNAAVSNGGLTFPSNGNPLPSIEQTVQAFLNAGVPASKLGIGIDFYGYVWSGGSGTSTGGVTKPNQSWNTAPDVTDNVPYHKIMDQYYNEGTYHWDSNAQGAYLSIDQSGSSNDKFISYDDEKSIQAKFEYARQNNLGGLIIWELSGGYRENEPAGERDLLLQEVKAQLNDSGSGSGGGDDPIDSTAPVVSIDSPSNGSTLSGVVSINLSASDNNKLQNVDIHIDGSLIKSFSSSPFTYDWDTQNHENHTCYIEAIATDTAGNTTSTSISVDVNNTTGGGDDPSSDSEVVYDESLQSPWINTSWSTSVDFINSTQSYDGSNAIKVDQSSWGALALHSGSWSTPVDIDPGNYDVIEFMIYAESQSSDISVQLENDLGNSFSAVSFGKVSANQWIKVQIPMTELNPNGYIFHRIDILERSGNSKTYYVDNLQLLGEGSSSDEPVLETPTLGSPASGATGVSTSPSLSWSGSTTGYDLQVATNESFTSFLTNQQALSSTSYSLSGLSEGTTYYWRVLGTDLNGNNSSWSSTSNFTTKTTQSDDPIAGSYIYNNELESPWIDASWSASIDYSNADLTANAIRVDQDAWGALSIHSGNWGDSKDLINTSRSTDITFKVYAVGQTAEMSVKLANDSGQSFPSVSIGDASSGQWSTISVPLSDLNPNNYTVHRLTIQDTKGTTQTFYVDELRVLE